MELPRPKEVAKQTHNSELLAPLPRHQRKDLERATRISLYREQALIALVELRQHGYNHLHKKALELGLARADELEKEYASSENPMRRRLIEEAFEVWVKDMASILSEYRS
jgi:hypothetical protein